MIKYYTRACNFYYGHQANLLIKKKQALPLYGNKGIAFNTLEVFKEAISSDDEDFDDAHDFVVDNYDPEECYEWQYSQIKGGYETDWYADDECIEPRGEPMS